MVDIELDHVRMVAVCRPVSIRATDAQVGPLEMTPELARATRSAVQREVDRILQSGANDGPTPE